MPKTKSKSDTAVKTINDIARLAGVSKKSVSRVLNDEAGVSDATRDAIKAIIAEHGYAPSRGARALAGSKSFLIALAYDNPNPAFVLKMLQGMQSVSGAKGYEVVMLAVPRASIDPVAEISSFMQRSSCDGVVLSPPLSENPDVITAFSRSDWATVRIAGDDVDLQQSQVRYDDRAAAVAITSHLLDLGHLDIAFVGGPPKSGPTRRRLAGFKDALSSRGVDVNPELISWGDFTFDSGFGAGQALMAHTPRPSAVMCANDEMASGVIHAVREAGLRVPDGVSVTGFDDSALAQQLWPPLSSVRQPIEEMAAAAATLLIDLIEDEHTAARLRGFSHELVIRKSTASSH